MIKRIKFQVPIFVFLIVLLFSSFKYNSKEENSYGILFPRPFAFAIDDMGWINGSNIGENGKIGPYRAGVKRIFDVSDYNHVIDVAKATGVRLQGLFILGEMDKFHILKNYPTTTQYGAEWDNTENISDRQDEIMKFVKENAAYLEFGLHGVGHEYWPEKGVRKRAEWYNLEDDIPWPEESVREHVNVFKKLMEQYGISEENGHSFPESFVPCAYGYYWNPGVEYSLGKVLSDNGVKYANTDFGYIRELNPPEGPNGGGFDNGLLVVNRLNYGNEWFQMASLPRVSISEQESDIIETHFPNWLAQDDFLQPPVTKKFIDYYRMVQQMADRIVAKNTEQFYSQWLYKKYTKIDETTPGNVVIDNTKMPDDPYLHDMLGNLILKIKLDEGKHVSSANINNEKIPAYFEDGGYGILYLPPLRQEKYILTYSIGNEMMPEVVYNDGTYNCYQLQNIGSELQVDLKIYGTQTVKIRCNKLPGSVITDNAAVKILNTEYETENNWLSVVLNARNIQGEKTKLILE
ncbi:MAG: hypothetical protein JXJ22_03985 [Bacteroidales bacterium]|nr:hypothetical protein [Bacteroidales bacterium]